MTELRNLTIYPKREMKVLFVCSSGKVFEVIPFIKSQYESLIPHVSVMEFYRVKGGGLRAYFAAYRELKRKLKTQEFDIIHAHWTYAGILCSLLKGGEKLIVSFMGNDLHGFYSKRLKIPTLKGIFNIIVSQLLLYKVNGVIVKSGRMKSWIPPFFKYKTVVIPNGVNLKRFKNLDRIVSRKYLSLEYETRYILFLGDKRDSNKNFTLLNMATCELDREGIEYKIIAPYPVNAQDVPYYLASTDVLAFPSRMEGSPNLIKEAIAMGCPIVSTDVGDVRERFEGIEGCFISSFDKSDFARKLKLALSYGKRYNPVAQLDKISEEKIAEEIIEFYTSVLLGSEKKDCLR